VEVSDGENSLTVSSPKKSPAKLKGNCTRTPDFPLDDQQPSPSENVTSQSDDNENNNNNNNAHTDRRSEISDDELSRRREWFRIYSINLKKVKLLIIHQTIPLNLKKFLRRNIKSRRGNNNPQKNI